VGFTNKKGEKTKGLTTTTTTGQQENIEYLDPYSIFKYAMNSPVTRDRHTTRLDRFFSFVGIEGIDVEERCRVFVQNARKDDSWAFRSIINFLQVQKEYINRKEITGSTVRNYVKAIKLFTEMNDVLIPWKRITRLLHCPITHLESGGQFMIVVVCSLFWL
jgi:hypothetical protein